jgi:plasmid stabilization system protein ParE
MKVEFTKRAARDLHEIANDSRRRFGDRVAAALEVRFRDVVAGIAHAPESAPRVEQRPGMRVVPGRRRCGENNTRQACSAASLGLIE